MLRLSAKLCLISRLQLRNDLSRAGMARSSRNKANSDFNLVGTKVDSELGNKIFNPQAESLIQEEPRVDTKEEDYCNVRRPRLVSCKSYQL